MADLARARTFVKDVTPFSTPKGVEAAPPEWKGAQRFRRVLLVFPDYKGGHFGALRPPAGLGYLAQILEEFGVEYEVLDMAVGQSEADLFDKIRDFGPDLVGISLMSFMYQRSYDIFGMIKETFPGITTVAGGPHLSCVREKVLEECDAIDYAVVKEGEAPLMDLVFGVECAEIPGLIWRRDGDIVFNGERAYERNFDVYPWPKFKKFPLGSYVTEEIGIETSRGCPQQCTFCPVIPSIGRKLRRRSPESVSEEISYWYERGYRQLSVLDDNFSVVREHTMAVCREIQSLGLRGLELNCNNGIRADRVDPEMLATMYATGFRYVAFGVEGGNDRVLAMMKKGESLEEIERAIQMTIDAGIQVTLFFIVGNPGETPEDVEDTKRIALTYPIFDARFYNMIPFPGSELYDWVAENDFFIKDPKDYLNNSSQWDFDPVFETPEFPFSERVRCLHEVREIRKRVRQAAMKRELHRLGILAPLVSRLYVNDRFQELLMKKAFVRRTLKRLYMQVTSTGGNAVSMATIRAD